MMSHMWRRDEVPYMYGAMSPYAPLPRLTPVLFFLAVPNFIALRKSHWPFTTKRSRHVDRDRFPRLTPRPTVHVTLDVNLYFIAAVCYDYVYTTGVRG
jgi:hypothetical protein